jgi:hypothetical protein
MKKIVPGILMVVVLALSLEAVVPRRWELRTKEDFLRGKFDGVSLAFDGVLTLAPQEDRIAGPSEEFYMSLLPEPDGGLFLGTGHGGKIYRIGADGKAELYFQTQEIDVTCLARNGKGVLFAGTSPNGKIYRITARGKGEEFFNPSEKYVWDLAFTESGSLLAAVGESGGIYEIDPQGQGRQVLKAEENHILCLKVSDSGDVYAGSGGGGSIYRLSRDGRAAVLFESPYEELRSFVLDKEGNIFAAASGTPSKRRKDEAPAPSVKADVGIVVVAASPEPSGPEAAPGPSAADKEPSALYKVSPNGVAKRLWRSADEMIYTVVLKENGTVLFGTGGKGRVYAVDRDEKTSLLLQEASEQAYLLRSDRDKIYIVGNNPCALGLIRPGQRLAGEYLSPVLDSRTVSSWGKMDWMAELGSGTSLQVLTRTGNSSEPNQTWSDWSPPSQRADEPILSPKARFLQFKALFKTPSGQASPSLQKTGVFYLQTNIAPAVDGLDVFKPNEAFLKPPADDDVVWGEEANGPETTPGKPAAESLMVAKRIERKGYRTVLWDASDENGDELSYALSIRKEGESEWRVLRPARGETIFAFDTLAYSDGTYFLKVTASDVPSNPPGTELQAERVGPPFVIDNSLPTVKGFTVARGGGGLNMSFQAQDAFSTIEEVKVLVRPGEWRVVFPVDGIADSTTESFKFSMKLPANAENLVTVRVRDAFGNVGIFQQKY